MSLVESSLNTFLCKNICHSNPSTDVTKSQNVRKLSFILGEIYERKFLMTFSNFAEYAKLKNILLYLADVSPLISVKDIVYFKL